MLVISIYTLQVHTSRRSFLKASQTGGNCLSNHSGQMSMQVHTVTRCQKSLTFLVKCKAKWYQRKLKYSFSLLLSPFMNFQGHFLVPTPSQICLEDFAREIHVRRANRESLMHARRLTVVLLSEQDVYMFIANVSRFNFTS